MEMPSEVILEEGYDSDMQFGPFIKYVVVEEEFASMDEEEKTVIELLTAEQGKSEEGEASDKLLRTLPCDASTVLSAGGPASLTSHLF